jgi:hypothetical protein
MLAVVLALEVNGYASRTVRHLLRSQGHGALARGHQAELDLLTSHQVVKIDKNVDQLPRTSSTRSTS